MVSKNQNKKKQIKHSYFVKYTNRLNTILKRTCPTMCTKKCPPHTRME